MAAPRWAKQHLKKGCEIKQIKGNYCLYERRSAWGPVRKRAKKVTGAYLGKVTPEGVVPPKKRVDAPVLALEYGAGALCAACADDPLEPLQEACRRPSGGQAWAVSMLNLVSRAPFRRMAERYESSWAWRRPGTPRKTAFCRR
ncbi:MAG: hypothetical protein FWF71_00385 [Actinomycetia bacterium]|nr:hypothetical protein [Actinomycetes bacterium]